MPSHNENKQAAALLVLAGLLDPKETNERVLAVDGADRISTFLGYYVLRARAEAGDIQGSLDCIRAYWGGMLSLGATTFWKILISVGLKMLRELMKSHQKGKLMSMGSMVNTVIRVIVIVCVTAGLLDQPHG